MAIDATDPDWVRKQLEWLTAPRLPLQERLARGRDRIREQFTAAEREHYARLRNQNAQASPSMGPPHGTLSAPHLQYMSASGAHKRKEPDWATNIYANGQPAQRQRVAIPRATPSASFTGPQGSFPHSGQGSSSMPAFSSMYTGASPASNPAYAIGQNRGSGHASPVALVGSSHAMPPQNQRSPPIPQPALAPASTPASAVTQVSQSHTVPPVRSLSSTARSSPIAIKQEAPTSNLAQPSYVHNSRSTTVECGSPAAPISGTSTPRRDDSLDVNSLQLSETRSHHQSSGTNHSRTPEEVQRPTPGHFVDDGPSAQFTPPSRASPGIDCNEASVITRAVGNEEAGDIHPAVESAQLQSSSTSTNCRTTSPTTPNASSSHDTVTAPALEKPSHDQSSASAEGASGRPVQSADVTNAPNPLASPRLNAPQHATTHGDRPSAAAAAPSSGTSSGTARASPESNLIVPLDHRPAHDAMPAISPVMGEPSTPDDIMDVEDVHMEAGNTTSPAVDAAQPRADTPKEPQNEAGSAVSPKSSARSRASSSSISSLVETPSETSLHHGSPGIDGARQKELRASIASSTSGFKEATPPTAAAPKASAQISGSESRTTSSSSASTDFRHVQDRSPPKTGSGTRESLPVRRPSDNVWSDRRRPSARQVSPAAESTRVSSETAIQSSADIRHRLEKHWPNVNLKRYEGFNRNMIDKIAFFAARDIPERVIRAHINMEVLLRMERRSKIFGTNNSEDPYPTESDCTQIKNKYWAWQKKKNNHGVAAKHFPIPDGTQAEELMRKFSVQATQDGFLEYQNKQVQPAGTERNRNTQRVRLAQTEEASLATGPGLTRQLKRPEWYVNIKQQDLQSRSRKDGYTGVDAKLGKIKQLMRDCAEKRIDLFDDIRRELHQLAFLEVNKIVVRKAQMLHEDTGLPQLFAAEYSKGVDYPWDIQADALELYNRWSLKIFSTDLLRGIVKSQKAHNRSTDRIEPGFPGKSGAAYYGQGDLVNGQWWPTQLCTVRDGAHGSTQGGIYSVKGKAAFSIIVSGGSHYNDRDEGYELWYSGTNSTDGKYTENTQSLMLSVEHKNPVRVIRSHNIHKGASKFRPARGFRYDGLYDVVGYEVVDESKKACLFHMVRRPGQDPIRAEGKAMRPTEEEIAEYDRIKKELNEVGSNA